MMTNHDTLVAAFSALSDEQLGNLKWHVDEGTPIYSGPGSGSEYVNEEGHF